MLAICTRYCHCEEAYLATRVANWAVQAGIPVTLRNTTGTPAKLGLPYDMAVANSARLSFGAWLRGCTRVFWTHMPPAAQALLAHQPGVRVVAYSHWDAFTSEHREVMRGLSHVLTGTRARCQYLQKNWGVEALYLPWDNGLAPMRRTGQAGQRLTVLLPLLDREVYRMELTTLRLVARLLQRHRHVDLTVAYTASTLASQCSRQLRQLRQQFGEPRVQLLPRVRPSERHFLYMAADLLLWPCHSIGVGMLALDALAMGLPVAAFGFSPITEFLGAENAVLAAAPGYIDQLGRAQPRPDYDDLEARLDACLSSPDCVGLLQTTASVHTVARRRVFEDALAIALGDRV